MNIFKRNLNTNTEEIYIAAAEPVVLLIEAALILASVSEFTYS